jgi:hypothetical protein
LERDEADGVEETKEKQKIQNSGARSQNKKIRYFSDTAFIEFSIVLIGGTKEISENLYK